ncbi:hypothetical protein [Brachybacterium epidermidis]|uniref:hypothetical protein n=1 Tax=Brachybacterium epidermidis TaxID=2781983 RepID=UPI00398E5838
MSVSELPARPPEASELATLAAHPLVLHALGTPHWRCPNGRAIGVAWLAEAQARVDG